MQRSFSVRPGSHLFGTLSILLGLLIGCGPSVTPPTSSGSRQPLAGIAVTVACADPAMARRLADRAAGWGAKSGAKVRVETKGPGDRPDADIFVVRPSELGALGANGDLAPVPAEFRAADNPVQWGRIVVGYRTTLVSWGGEVQAIPLAGEAYALVYRADRFADEAHQKAFAAAHGGRVLDPPTTWEDLADIARFFTETDKKPSLPALPNDPQRLTTQFQQVAACYDRRALTEVEAKAMSQDAPDAGTAFHFQSGTWTPRLASPGFVAAASWFARTRTDRIPGASDDPVAALEGTAVMAVLSLAEIARLPKEGGQVSRRYKLVPVPGTRTYFDAAGKSQPAARQGNYIPFLGSASWVGCVSRKSGNAAAAWDLLADLAGPSSSLAAVGAPGAGVGPFRTEHLVAERRDVWLGYGFDAEGTQALFAAMQQYLASNVTNPALTLRTPDQAAVMNVLADALRQAAAGEISPETAMGRADDAWKKLDAGRRAEELVKWRRNAIGLP